MSIDFFDMFSAATWSGLSVAAAALIKNLIVACIVYYLGGWVIRKVVAIIKKIFEKRNLEPSLSGFLVSIVNVALWLMLIIAIITILGIETSSFVALFTGAGMAIGMAMSGTLSNFSGGVMILLFKPYKVGEYIKAQGYEGIVKEIQIFNTILTTLDNRTIIIPNGGLSTGSLENVSRQPYRRADVNFEFAYGTDYEVVREKIEQIQKGCPMIVQEPISGTRAEGPWQGLSNLGESSCTITTRSWCKSGDYANVVGYMNYHVYQELRKEVFMFPFKQMDVHSK